MKRFQYAILALAFASAPAAAWTFPTEAPQAVKTDQEEAKTLDVFVLKASGGA